MIQTSDINREVERFFQGQITLRDLTQWLAAEGWQLREAAAPDAGELEALELVRLLDLHIARHTSGLCSRDELALQFRQVLSEILIAETTWTISGQTRHSEGLAHNEYSTVAV